MRTLMTALIGISLYGCSGVSIQPITIDSAKKAHEAAGNVPGYIVYHPMVVVEIAEREVCVSKAADGKCANSELRCAVGQPIVLPDHSKPYVVDIRSGLGKAGVDVQIVDGWRLGAVKDQSDNSGILAFIQKFAEAKLFELDHGRGSKAACKEPGLYTVTTDGSSAQLKKLKVY